MNQFQRDLEEIEFNRIQRRERRVGCAFIVVFAIGAIASLIGVDPAPVLVGMLLALVITHTIA